LTNLLIPADLTSTLQVPDLTVSTGEPGGVWCAGSWGVLYWSRRYVVRLPYDPVAAAKLRKLAVLHRISLALLPVYLSGMWVWLRPIDPRLGPVALCVLILVVAALRGRWQVNQIPSRTGRGDMYLPALPPEVAYRWLETNPGIRAVGRKPTYRRWPAWVYAAGSVVCAVGTIATARWLVIGGFDVAPAMMFGSLVLAYLALPTGQTRLHGNGSVP